jgi:hypothetical protein
VEEEEEEELEVDLSAFLERQRLGDETILTTENSKVSEDEDDVDYSLRAKLSNHYGTSNSKKGQVHQIEWDKNMDDLRREKLSAEAVRGSSFQDQHNFSVHSNILLIELIARFRNESVNMDRYGDEIQLTQGRCTDSYDFASAKGVFLADPELEKKKPAKGSKEEMEAFLDDLLD